MVERHRREGDECGTSTKIIAFLVVLSLIAMLCYSVWRIRDIEEPSESNDYDYRMIGTEDIDDYDDDTNDNIVDET